MPLFFVSTAIKVFRKLLLSTELTTLTNESITAAINEIFQFAASHGYYFK